VRIDACTISTQMVKLQTVWYRLNQTFVSEPMSHRFLTVCVSEYTITISSLGTSPQKTVAEQRYF
jgi:hypothetical protein